MKFSIMFLSLISSTCLLSQIDSNQLSHLDSFILEVEALAAAMEAPFRNELSEENKKELAYFNQLTEKNEHFSKILRDSLLVSLNKEGQSLIMLEKLANMIATQTNSIRLLLDNMEVSGHNPYAIRPWEGTKYPCYETLFRLRGYDKIATEILFTDFLNDYKISTRGLGDSLSYLIELINFKPYAKELVELSLRHSQNKNKTKLLQEMLNRMGR